MTNKDHLDLEKYLTELMPNWRDTIPDLLNSFAEISLDAGEFLPIQRGDIYYVAKGIIGKYAKRDPLRYLLMDEIIIVPLRPSLVNFKALTSSKVMLIQRPDLYKILERSPQSIVLYDELLMRQQESLDFRNQILRSPKSERLELFRKRYGAVIPIINRKELADYLKVSIQYLRKLF